MFNYLGEEIVELFEDTVYAYYVVLEPITWHDLFKSSSGDSNTGKSFYGTFYNWMEFYDSKNWPSNFTSPLDQHILGTCMQLIRDESSLGLTNPGAYTEYFTLDNVGSQGWGIHLYYNQDMIKTQTTYDESVGDKPHKAPAESEGAVTIVKNYRYSEDGGTTFKDGGCFIRENTYGKIIIEKEPSYKIKAWRISKNILTSIDSLKWEETVNSLEAIKSGKTTDSINIKGKVALYILYEKVTGEPPKEEVVTGDAEFTIPESSLTQRIRFSEKAKTAILTTNGFSWTAPPFALAYDKECGWIDYRINVSLTNAYATIYDNVLISKNGWENVVMNSAASSMAKYWAEIGRSYTTGSTISRITWDYMCVLKRGQDKLTVAEWKNDASVNQLMREIGFNVSNNKTGTRKSSDYVDSFNAYFTEDGGVLRDVTTIYGNYIGKVEVSEYQFVPSTALEIKDIKVNVETYSGKSNSTEDTSKTKIEAGTISFYPYIQMKYDTYVSPYSFNSAQLVNVLGDHQRTITFYDAAEISFKKKGTNIDVLSSQWSTHASVQNGLETLLGDAAKDKNVMPGGVMYDIQITPDNYQTMDVVTYQTVLEGDGLTQVNNTGSITGDLSKDNVKRDHDNYVDSVITAVNGVNVVQYVDTNATKENAYDGQIVKSGMKFGSRTLSAESKYYFNDYADTYLEAKLLGTSTNAYTFRVGTDGCVYMNDSLILKKGQDYTQIADKIAKNIDNKTLVVRKLLEGLETNTGDDTTAKWAASDGKWYNEAFDGVTVYIQASKLSIGFKDTNEKGSILDPRLIPAQGYGMENVGKSFYISQFATKTYSDVYGAGQKNKLGVFKGVAVYTSDLNKLFTSKPFYITNITVQDLN